MTLLLKSSDATRLFAEVLAQHLMPGDTILLDGDIGAGKTFLARALIQSLQDVPEDVPSPTFTLVQTYDTSKGEIWHSDLYRIGSVHELDTLGLLDAFETAICLVEWPDRLADMTPETALRIVLESDQNHDDTRQADVSWTHPDWDARMAEIAKQI